MLSNAYFWTAVITSTCWSFLVAYPFLIAQQSSINPMGDKWKETGAEIAEDEESSTLEFIPKIGIIFYAFVMIGELGFLVYMGVFFLGYILAFSTWYLLFRLNPITSKIFLTVLWYLTTAIFLVYRYAW